MSSLYPEQQLKRRATAWAVRLKVNPERVAIADMPDKWGSSAHDIRVAARARLRQHTQDNPLIAGYSTANWFVFSDAPRSQR